MPGPLSEANRARSAVDAADRPPTKNAIERHRARAGDPGEDEVRHVSEETMRQDRETEVRAFAEHMTSLLRDSAKVAERVGALRANPLSLFNVCADGVVLAAFINAIKPGTVPERAIQYNVSTSRLRCSGTSDAWNIACNNNAVLEGARALGIKTVNIGSEDILQGTEDLVLGLIWQLVRAHLMVRVNLVSHPELIRLMERGETIQQMLDMGSEGILLRWVNYHLRRAGHARRIANFGRDVADSECYAVLLEQIAGDQINVPALRQAMASTSLDARARAVLEQADAIQCRQFATVAAIVQGSSRLNLAFTAVLFNNHIGITLPSEDELAAMHAEIKSLRQRVQQLERELASVESSKKSSTSDAAMACLERDRALATVASLEAAVASSTRQMETSEAKCLQLSLELSKARSLVDAFVNHSQLLHDVAARCVYQYGADATDDSHPGNAFVGRLGGPAPDAGASASAAPSAGPGSLAHDHIWGGPLTACLSAEQHTQVMGDLCAGLASELRRERSATLRAHARRNSANQYLADVLAAVLGPRAAAVANAPAADRPMRLAELAAALCREQAAYIAELELQVKKHEMLGDLMGSKIRAIAESYALEHEGDAGSGGNAVKHALATMRDAVVGLVQRRASVGHGSSSARRKSHEWPAMP